jgi:succinate-semialdehyde dehydrogenase/glutarate-semialdehyde dehydrogenase
MNYKSYINGELISGKGSKLKVFNPATEELVGEVEMINADQANDTLAAAQKGFEYWSALTLIEREKWILKLRDAIEEQRDEIIDLLMAETGKLYSFALDDYQCLIDHLGFHIESAKQLKDSSIVDINGGNQHLVIREPLGVVVGYLAWNYPLLNVGCKLGPVLASGCSCILKPSSLTPIASLKIGEIAKDIGFPKGVINIVVGNSSEIGTVFNKSDITKMITLIGSSETGRKLIEESASSIKRFSLELGGNAPVIVLPDYDEKEAAKEIVDFKVAVCGQVCVSPNRVFVHKDKYESFIARAVEVAKTMKPGWGEEENNGANLSPLISEDNRKRIQEIIDDAVSKGARLLYGGTIPADKEKGYYLLPAILADVTSDMKCYKEEIFGPVLPVIKYDDQTDLVELSNDTEYGLASFVFTNNVNDIFNISRKLKFGTVCVNSLTLWGYYIPHGGIKESGIGKDCSTYSLEEYYYYKRIAIAVK